MSWFNRKPKPLTAKEQASKRLTEIELEYLGLNVAPAQAPQQKEWERQAEIHFTVKNDILRYNMSKSADVPTEGNEF